MLELQEVSYLGKDKKILDDISFSVPGNSFLVITGPNGSGKSTLVKLIMGVIKPTSGKIIFNGQDITNLSITDRAKLGISYAFQQPVAIKGIRVRDLIEIAANSSNEAILSKHLKAVGLAPADYLDRELNSSLSGGEMKRIEIASVLARKSVLTIFDEPEAGIDLWSYNDLLKIFKKFKKDSRSIIVISHQERILKSADKILVLKDGKVVKYGPKEKIIPTLDLGGLDA